MILALDVGFKSTGYAVFKKGIVKATGVIETTTAEDKKIKIAYVNARRASQIAISLKLIIEACKGNVKGVVGELPSGAALSARAGQAMALATGTVAAAIAVLGLPVEWVTPVDVKRALTGNTHAKKYEIMREVSRRYDYVKFPENKSQFEHIADAIGAYIAAAESDLVKLHG